jgi:hypothetical protein
VTNPVNLVFEVLSNFLQSLQSFTEAVRPNSPWSHHPLFVLTLLSVHEHLKGGVVDKFFNEREISTSIFMMSQQRGQLTGKIFIVNHLPLRAQYVSMQVDDSLMGMTGRIVNVVQIQNI